MEQPLGLVSEEARHNTIQPIQGSIQSILIIDPTTGYTKTENANDDENYDDTCHEWEWDTAYETSRLQLAHENLEVKFHPGFSTGTAAVRGNKPMTSGKHHWWEVKMLTPVYGTDVMVGVGTAKADLLSTGENFCSLLGRDKESWGFSYRGYIQHGGISKEYSTCFHQNSRVGVHYDGWQGTLEFFHNGNPLGIAFTGLQNLELYPMVCSTAAKSRMKIINSCSVSATLQLHCLSLLKSRQKKELLELYPGLKYKIENIFSKILQKVKDEDEDIELQYHTACLDDFDFALVGCKPLRKQHIMNEENLIELLPSSSSNLPAILL
ncbi:SPRY domain-containing SOCS box protein 3-like [Trichogramma pretiosum]|uniref:SPRY domain-containing SOCS box protein 3-like n=1 Tax=Trichogramma pretiosum TaxID=7493 RepID=UPI0006C9DB83|nr:SPRY domain-containing SOCS box protein 3-like [Trichogramma pretiosum]